LLPGGVCLRRGFNCPTGLESGEKVWLVVEELQLGGNVRFNGELLGQLHPHVANYFELTAKLLPRNEICLELESGGEGPLPEPEGVRIEIRAN
jgi:hypothetical protein